MPLQCKIKKSKKATTAGVSKSQGTQNLETVSEMCSTERAIRQKALLWV